MNISFLIYSAPSSELNNKTTMAITKSTASTNTNDAISLFILTSYTYRTILALILTRILANVI